MSGDWSEFLAATHDESSQLHEIMVDEDICNFGACPGVDRAGERQQMYFEKLPRLALESTIAEWLEAPPEMRRRLLPGLPAREALYETLVACETIDTDGFECSVEPASSPSERHERGQ